MAWRAATCSPRLLRGVVQVALTCRSLCLICPSNAQNFSVVPTDADILNRLRG